jgi:hypothetical protein
MFGTLLALWGAVPGVAAAAAVKSAVGPGRGRMRNIPYGRPYAPRRVGHMPFGVGGLGGTLVHNHSEVSCEKSKNGKCEKLFSVPLEYQGGAVLTEPKLYLIFWGSNFTKLEEGQKWHGALVNTLRGMTTEYNFNTTYQRILHQYWDEEDNPHLISDTVTVAGEYISEAAPAQQSVNKSIVEEDINYAIEVNHWSRTPDSVFLLMQAPGTVYEQSFTEEEGGFCGFHEVDRWGDVYGFVPDLENRYFSAGCVENENYKQALDETATHEYAEAVTDPHPKTKTHPADVPGWTNSAGWEIADLCDEAPGLVNEELSIWVNALWGNNEGECVTHDPPESGPSAPSVTTEAATGISKTAATLHGAVNPNGPETHYYFEYGETTAYGHRTGEDSAGSGTTTVYKLASISVEGWRTYHYRIVASSWAGTSYGNDETFSTPAPTWSVQTTANPAGTAAMNGTSCPTSSYCVAVGYYASGSTNYARIERWNGSEWSAQKTASPSGAAEGWLGGVSCTSSTACTAVGQYKSSAGEQLPFVERWNGTEWTLQSMPNPSGSKATLLHGVSCPTEKACVAVGTYTNSSGVEVNLAESWNGSEWAIKSTPNQEGATANRLTGVSCVSAESCMASANEVSGGSYSAYIEHWNGTAWSIQGVGTPSGAQQSAMLGVSCTSATECTGVGDYENSTSWVTLVERYNGKEWSVQSSPNPAEAGVSRLNGVSCTSSTYCIAVGYSQTTYTANLREIWNGKEWSIKTGGSPSGAREGLLGGVSCTSETACIGVGYYVNSSSFYQLLAERWNGSEWSALPTEAPAFSLRHTSCISSTSCTAVGSYTSTVGQTVTLAEQWNGSSWSVQTTPVPVPSEEWSMTGVSCTSSTFCMAVANDRNGSKHWMYSQVWNGSEWTITGVATPSGATEGWLNGVACTASTECTAVGSYKNSSGTIVTLAERWNGSGWSVQSTPNPSGATEWSLTAVSCPTSTACWAVAEDHIPNYHWMFAEYWNGSEWVVSGVATPSGATEGWLKGVACRSSTECTAVGSYKNSSGTIVTLAERASSSGWSVQSTPNPSGATEWSLTGVSCPSSTSCWAVAEDHIPNYHWMFAEYWNGSEWTVSGVLTPSEAAEGWLEGIACQKRTECLLVGSYQKATGSRLTLAEHFS